MSLNSFLTRLIWLCVLPLILLSAYLAFDQVRILHTQITAAARDLGLNAAVSVDRMLRARIRTLALLAATHSVHRPESREHLYDVGQSFVQSFDAHLILADAGMNMLMNTRVPEGTPLPKLPRPQGRAATPEALETGEPAVGDLFSGPFTKEPLVAIAVPVKDGGRVTHLLLAVIEANQFLQRLRDVALPEHWVLTLRDSSGGIIARRGSPDAIASINAGGGEIHVAKPVQAPWQIEVGVPKESHWAPLVNSAFGLGLMVIGAALIGLIGGAHASRRLHKAVSALMQEPAAAPSPTPVTEITEIASIRGLIDDAVAQRMKAEHANRETQQRYIERLEKVFMSAVEVATNLGELRDPFNAGHQRRAANLAAAIGAELGFDAQRQEGLRVAGFLYDIGKISVPAEILSRPAKLTAPEFDLVKSHCQASYDVLSKVEFPWPVAEAALQHHERLDGSGYPRGLKGDEILLEARVLGVADVVEAMCSHRPYRPARSVDEALAEIEGGSGTRYDATVVAACVRLFREKGYQLSG
jgi:hypothetical protein